MGEGKRLGTWNNFCPNCAVDMGLRKPFPDGARAERPPTMAEMQEYICLRQRDGKVKKVHMPTQTYHNNEPLFQPRKKAT